jgi:UDP-2,3-diacylglucosamine pyrophosphatase LpxH
MTNFVLMGDVHSVFSRFERALFFITENIQDYHLVMLGDVFDSRCEESDSVALYRAIRQLQNDGKATLIHSNHQWKLQRYLRGNPVKIDASLQKTLDDFAASDVTSEELMEWLDALPFAVSFKDADDLEYRCSHAYFSSKLYIPLQYNGIYSVNEVSRHMRDKLIYGVTNSDGNRIQWWDQESDNDWVRCGGHYHRVAINYNNNSIVLDSSCGDVDGLLSIFDVNSRTLHQF